MEGALPLIFFLFLHKVKKIAVVVVHLFKAGSIYPRLTTKPTILFPHPHLGDKPVSPCQASGLYFWSKN